MLYRGKSITFGVWSACTENKTAHLISNYLHVTYSTYSISYHMAQNVPRIYGYCGSGTVERVQLYEYCCTAVLLCTVQFTVYTLQYFPGFHDYPFPTGIEEGLI